MVPRHRLTWRLRLLRFLSLYIYPLETPLQLRGTLTRLRHNYKHPFLELLRLLLPIPTWYFPLPDLIPFRTMLGNVELLDSRLGSVNYPSMRSIPLWRARDTPLRSIYRIYEAITARECVVIGSEVEYFFYQTRKAWAVHRIPDPCDTDPVRYAILASIVEELACAFNWRMGLGMRCDRRKHIYRATMDEVLPPFPPETAPAWAASVPAIDAQWVADLPGDALDPEGRLVLEKGAKNARFLKRNILAGTGYFYTI
ncbi:hypothetical protein I7I48_07038 [Histoplasma ohiense]|nr:hypothetical protein I7I48_07038 [Histoplasma ohiense (nom. inval.)]